MPRLLRSQPAAVRADYLGEERVDHFITIVVDDQVTKAVGKVGAVTTTEDISPDALTIAGRSFSVGNVGTVSTEIIQNIFNVDPGAAKSVGKAYGSNAHPEFITVGLTDRFLTTDLGLVRDKWTKLIPSRDTWGGIDFSPSEPEIGVGEG